MENSHSTPCIIHTEPLVQYILHTLNNTLGTPDNRVIPCKNKDKKVNVKKYHFYEGTCLFLGPLWDFFLKSSKMDRLKKYILKN